MGKLVPIFLALIGLGAGVGAGLMLRPPTEIVEINPCGDPNTMVQTDHPSDTKTVEPEEGTPTSDFVKMNNQFVIPVVGEGHVRSLVVVSLSLEIALGGSEEFYQREPKLRDAFLQELFNHANLGGFDGVFTDSVRLSSLRMALEEVAGKIMTVDVFDVLVTDIVRQDI